MDVTKVKEYMAESKRATKKARKFTKRSERLLDKAQKLCEHTVTTEEDVYFAGSYLDKAKTTTYVRCALCGLQVDTKTQTHNWYG